MRSTDRLLPAILVAMAALAACAGYPTMSSHGGRGPAYVMRVELIPLNRLANGSCVSNEVFSGTASVYVRPINASFAEARVVLDGKLNVLEGEKLVCSGAYLFSRCRLLVGKHVKARLKPFNVTLTYILNRRFNYAWLVLEGGGERFIGFFPYYIAPDITYSNASKLKVLYMGEELKLLMDNESGEPMPVHVKVYGRTFYTVRLSNRYIAIYLVHHYPVEVLGITELPKNPFHTNSSLVRLHGIMNESMINAVLRADNYPADVVVIDWGKVAALAAAVGGGVTAAAYAVIRRRRVRGRA